MKTVIIHGQDHHGSTYHIARELAEKTGSEITEFFLPRDFGEFCTGCNTCFGKGESHCPHAARLDPIKRAMDAADLIILASPVYVFHATGAMKAFLDHLGHRWMVHRPEAGMFRKQGVSVCTAAGAGTRSTLKDMDDSLFFWGVAKRYKLGMNLAAVNWEGVRPSKKAAIDRATTRLAAKLVRRNGRVRPGLKTRLFFWIMHFVQRKGFGPLDAEYWKSRGWTASARPWK